jgi:hypothetical protein
MPVANAELLKKRLPILQIKGIAVHILDFEQEVPNPAIRRIYGDSSIVEQTIAAQRTFTRIDNYGLTPIARIVKTQPTKNFVTHPAFTLITR